MPTYEVTKDLGVVEYRLPFRRDLVTVLRNVGSSPRSVDVSYEAVDSPLYIKLPNPFRVVINGEEERTIISPVIYDPAYPDTEYINTIIGHFHPEGQEEITVRFNIRFVTPFAVITDEASNDPKQQKIHYMAGRYWVFFSNGAALYYVHSDDAYHWSQPIRLFGDLYGPIPQGFRFDTYFDGTYLHIAYWTDGPLWYVRGIPNADGTITFTEPSLVSPGEGLQTLSLTVDSDGYPWIAEDGPFLAHPFLGYGVNGVVVFKSSRNDGVWETQSGFPQVLEDVGPDIVQNMRATIRALPDGRVLALWTSTPDIPVPNPGHARVSVWDGSSFGPTVYSIGSGDSISYGLVVDGDIAHFVYVSDVPNDGIYYEQFDVTTNTFTTREYIPESYDYELLGVGMITLDQITHDILVSWLTKRGSDVPPRLRRSRRSVDGVWSPVEEYRLPKYWADGSRPSASFTITPAGIGYFYVEGAGPTYDLRIIFIPV